MDVASFLDWYAWPRPRCVATRIVSHRVAMPWEEHRRGWVLKWGWATVASPHPPAVWSPTRFSRAYRHMPLTPLPKAIHHDIAAQARLSGDHCRSARGGSPHCSWPDPAADTSAWPDGLGVHIRRRWHDGHPHLDHVQRVVEHNRGRVLPVLLQERTAERVSSPSGIPVLDGDLQLRSRSIEHLASWVCRSHAFVCHSCDGRSLGETGSPPVYELFMCVCVYVCEQHACCCPASCTNASVRNRRA